jgi:hypothetical protein
MAWQGALARNGALTRTGADAGTCTEADIRAWAGACAESAGECQNLLKTWKQRL